MGKGGDNSTVAAAAIATTTTSATDYHQDFLWLETDEPHAMRRKAILKKYPEIKQLYGHDPTLKYKIVAAVAIQFAMAYYFRHQFSSAALSSSNSSGATSWWFFWTATWAIGGTLNHMCTMGLHELSHNLGFKLPKHNRWFAWFTNIPLGVPAAVSFKRYHMDHHKYQGIDGIDVDVPTVLEGKIFNNPLSKAFFVCFQILFYAFRPMFVNPKPPVLDELINAVIVLGVQAAVYFGWGPSAVAYLFLSTLLGTGLHPVAGHFIAEHYVFPKDRAHPTNETYSYYGPVNYLTFNVGYHNEHHDFPFIPGSRLPQVRRIAAEFYDPLPYHTSYTFVLLSYIFNPRIGAFSRVKRAQTAPDSALECEADALVKAKNE